VFEAAQQHDSVAAGILTAAASGLAALAESLVGYYGKSGKIPVALAGGNLAAGRSVRAPVVELLKKTARLAPKDEPLDPAEGALALARRAPS
jgi:N-acetylglucosamine kinase-like BadF-type ATPase